MALRTGPLPASLKNECPMRMEQKREVGDEGRGTRGWHLPLATRRLPLWLGVLLLSEHNHHHPRRTDEAFRRRRNQPHQAAVAECGAIPHPELRGHGRATRKDGAPTDGAPRHIRSNPRLDQSHTAFGSGADRRQGNCKLRLLERRPPHGDGTGGRPDLPLADRADGHNPPQIRFTMTKLPRFYSVGQRCTVQGCLSSAAHECIPLIRQRHDARPA